MCEKTKHMRKNIDPCMRDGIRHLQENGVVTVSSCCGHGKYPPTIIALIDGVYYEILTRTRIDRIKRFYKRDNQGYYFVPECSCWFQQRVSHFGVEQSRGQWVKTFRIIND